MAHIVYSNLDDRSPLFSVVVAVYNVEKYLEAFLKSIEKQTIYRENIEYIFINDASTDRSLQILIDWARERNNVCIISNSSNLGVAESRNAGYSVARGVWVTSADPDDILDSHYFSAVQRVAIHAPENLALLTTRVLILDDALNIVKATHPLDFKYRDGDRIVSLVDSPENIQLGATAFLRLDVIRRKKLSFDPLIRPNFEDGNLISKYLLCFDNPHVALIASARYYYRKRQSLGSIIQTSWKNPDKYTMLIRNGYIDLMRYAARVKDTIPNWLQNVVVYDISWFLTEAENPRGALGWLTSEPRLLTVFLKNLKELFSLLSIESIAAFSIRYVPDHIKGAIIAQYFSDCCCVPVSDDPAVTGHVRKVYTRKSMDSDSLAQLFDGAVKVIKIPQAIYLFGQLFAYEALVSIPPESMQAYDDERDVAWTTFASPVETTSRSRLKRMAGADSVFDAVKFLTSANAYLRCLPSIDSRSAEYKALARKVISKVPTLLRRVGLEVALKTAPVYERFTKIDRKYRDSWILVDRMNGANDNAEHLYRYIASKHLDINAYFMIGKEARDYRRLKMEGFKILPHDIISVVSAIRHASVIIASDWAAEDLAYIWNVQHSACDVPLVFLQHGVTINDISYWLNGLNLAMIVTTLSPEHQYLTGVTSPYRFHEGQAVRLGLPRYDRLRTLTARAQARKAVVFADSPIRLVMMPTWRNSVRDTLRNITNKDDRYREFRMSSLYRHWNSLLDDPEITALIDANQIEVAYVAHPNMVEYLPLFTFDSRIARIDIRAADFQQLLADSDVFVTDYSSAAFDAVVAENIIAYYQFDKDEFFGGVQSMRPGWFDYEKDGYGPVFTRESDMRKWLISSIHNHSYVDQSQGASVDSVDSAEYARRCAALRADVPSNCCMSTFEEISVRFGQ